jgi:hypothetical protein
MNEDNKDGQVNMSKGNGDTAWVYPTGDSSSPFFNTTTNTIWYFDENGKYILSRDDNGHYTFYVPMDSVINYLLKREDNAWEQYNELFFKCTGRKNN